MKSRPRFEPIPAETLKSLNLRVSPFPGEVTVSISEHLVGSRIHDCVSVLKNVVLMGLRGSVNFVSWVQLEIKNKKKNTEVAS